jgi:hypothetical protein
VSRFAAGKWSVPTAVHHDGWRIEACPINGPAVSARGRDVAVAWFTAKTDQGHVFVAFSHDAGRTFGPPRPVDDAAAEGRVSIELLDDRSAAVTWIEFAGQRSQFRVRTVATNGDRSQGRTVSEAPGSRYPRIARVRDELLFAWTEADNDVPRIRTARATIRPRS